MLQNPITLILAGLAIVLVGAVWAGAAVFGRSKGGWRNGLALGVGFGASAAGLLAYDPSLALASGCLSAASLLFAVLRTPFPGWVAEAAGRPLPQAGSLVLAGLLAVGYGMYRIDAGFQKDMDDAMNLLGAETGPVDLGPSGSPAALTDQGRSVPLWVLASSTVESLQSFSEEDYVRRLRLEARLIQTGTVDGDYNCHGWVFTGGKFWVRGAWVETILIDNGYRETKKPMIGDLCVYRDGGGEVSHTAVVRGLGADGLILLESKWGKLGRYIHNATQDHAYSGHVPTYYRTKRGSHLLAGLP
ncbi:MAG: hypothetical protein ACRC33_02895, partial [Gemmataceae bacterium]